MNKIYLVFSSEDWLCGSKTLLYIGPDLEKVKTAIGNGYSRELCVYENGQLHSCQALLKGLKSAE